MASYNRYFVSPNGFLILYVKSIQMKELNFFYKQAIRAESNRTENQISNARAGDGKNRGAGEVLKRSGSQNYNQ